MHDRRVIFHVDDVGCAHSAIAAMERLWDFGIVTSGSVIVPSGWFAGSVEMARRRPEIDLGVHLTLTSESARYRWRPLSPLSTASGLIDDDGFLWPDVRSVRRHADPDAVEQELRAQVEAALASGIAVTHLDHHMGAALAPEFADGTAQIAWDHRLPILFPADLAPYLAMLLPDEGDDGVDPVDERWLGELRAELAEDGLAVAERFLMGLAFRNRPCRTVYEELLSGLGDGLTFVALHCATPGDIEAVHPKSAGFRVAEFRLFSDPEFAAWLDLQGIARVGFREQRSGT